MTGERDLARFPRSLGHKMTLVMVGVAVVLAAAPEIVRIVKHWPLNDEAYPPVVGPGDQARIYMKDSINSIKGYWRGQPTAKVHAEGSSAPAVVATASTNQNDWGSTISAKSSEKSSSSTPWVAVTFPSDAALAGKDVTCDVALHVNYPHFTGSSSFQTMSANMNRNLTLHLAPTVGAGGSYNEWWWEGTVGGMGLMLLCALLLLASARGLQKRAEPTRLLGPRASAPVPVGPPPPPVGQPGVPV